MKKVFGVTLATLCLLSGLALAAPAKRLLIIDSQDGEPYESARVAMVETLAAEGFVPGKNLEIERRNAQNMVGRGKRILMSEADKGFDVIFVNGTIANIAAHEFGYNNPKYKFVFCSITDPVGVGLVKQLNAPTDSNFTGVAYPVSVETRLRFLKEVLPDAKKIGFIYADMPQSESYIGWLKTALAKPEFSDLEFVYRKVDFIKGNKGHIRMAMLAKARVLELNGIVDAYMTPSDQLGTRKEFARTVSENSQKPLMALTESEIKEGWGAQFGVYMVQRISGKTAGKMVARILNGESVKEIIPVNPEGEYGINMKFSKKIGLTYPDSALEKAGNNIID